MLKSKFIIFGSQTSSFSSCVPILENVLTTQNRKLEGISASFLLFLTHSDSPLDSQPSPNSSFTPLRERAFQNTKLIGPLTSLQSSRGPQRCRRFCGTWAPACFPPLANCYLHLCFSYTEFLSVSLMLCILPPWDIGWMPFSCLLGHCLPYSSPGLQGLDLFYIHSARHDVWLVVGNRNI